MTSLAPYIPDLPEADLRPLDTNADDPTTHHPRDGSHDRRPTPNTNTQPTAQPPHARKHL